MSHFLASEQPLRKKRVEKKRHCQPFCFASKKHASRLSQVGVTVKQSVIKKKHTHTLAQTQSKSLHFKSLFVLREPQIHSEYIWDP